MNRGIPADAIGGFMGWTAKRPCQSQQLGCGRQGRGQLSDRRSISSLEKR